MDDGEERAANAEVISTAPKAAGDAVHLCVAELTEGNRVMRVASTMQMMSVRRFRAAGPATAGRRYSNFNHRVDAASTTCHIGEVERAVHVHS